MLSNLLFLQVEVCRLANLPDLDQNNDFVRNTLLQWIKNTIQKYDIDGIRIDTVPEVSCAAYIQRHLNHWYKMSLVSWQLDNDHAVCILSI